MSTSQKNQRKRLEIRLLGTFEVRLDEEPVTGFKSARVRAKRLIFGARST